MLKHLKINFLKFKNIILNSLKIKGKFKNFLKKIYKKTKENVKKKINNKKKF